MMKRYIVFLFCLLMPCISLSHQGKATSSQVEFDRQFGAWFVPGGNLTRNYFLNMADYWPSRTLGITLNPKLLDQNPSDVLPSYIVQINGKPLSIEQYVQQSPTNAMIVLHKGKIVYEAYPQMHEADSHIWFSVSKTLVSTSIAILEDKRLLDSRNTIDMYINELKGTAWQGIKIIDILDMASGIACPEVRSEENSCFWDFYHAFGWPLKIGEQGSWKQHLKQMKRAIAPGSSFDYTSVNTEVLRWLVEKVTKRDFVSFVENEIWRHVGAEQQAFFTLTTEGKAFSAGGFNSTLRDLARYGFLFTPTGRSKTKIISDEYLQKITSGGRPSLCDNECKWKGLKDASVFRHNSYQWDVVTHQGSFYKAGAGGQGLFISPSKHLVIAWFGTHQDGVQNQLFDVALEIEKSNLF